MPDEEILEYLEDIYEDLMDEGYRYSHRSECDAINECDCAINKTKCLIEEFKKKCKT